MPEEGQTTLKFVQARDHFATFEYIEQVSRGYLPDNQLHNFCGVFQVFDRIANNKAIVKEQIQLNINVRLDSSMQTICVINDHKYIDLNISISQSLPFRDTTPVISSLMCSQLRPCGKSVIPVRSSGSSRLHNRSKADSSSSERLR